MSLFPDLPSLPSAFPGRIPRWADRAGSFLLLLLCAAPLFLVTLKGWSSGILFVGMLLGSALLLWGRLPDDALEPGDRKWLLATGVALAAPVAAVAFAAALREDGFAGQFDAPARLALAIPVLLAVVRLRADAAAKLAWFLPAALLLMLAHRLVEGQPAQWPAERMTVGFADPLVFGYLSLGFALMCLASISPDDWRGKVRWSLLARVAGVLLGFYFSVQSGSRSGWLAVPLVLGLWLHFHWGRGHRAATLGALALVVLGTAAAYLLVSTVQERVNLAFKEVLEYSWNGGVAPDSSIALRITFLRIAAQLVALHPWAGVGDTDHMAPVVAGGFPFASPFAVKMAFDASFHNQIVSNTVRAGIGGFVATTAMLVVPLALCVRHVVKSNGDRCRNALMGCAFFTTILVASMSTEVVDLKYMASFYAVMTALLCGATLAAGHARPDPQRPLSAS